MIKYLYCANEIPQNRKYPTFIWLGFYFALPTVQRCLHLPQVRPCSTGHHRGVHGHKVTPSKHCMSMSLLINENLFTWSVSSHQSMPLIKMCNRQFCYFKTIKQTGCASHYRSLRLRIYELALWFQKNSWLWLYSNTFLKIKLLLHQHP